MLRDNRRCPSAHAAAAALLWLLAPAPYDLVAALPAVAGFVDTARCGALLPATLAAHPWLEPTPGSTDPVPGGFFTSGGDYVKHTLPLATSMTTLAWSLLNFEDGYSAAGVLDVVRSQLRWGAQYLMAAHTAPTELVVQVGRPEDYWPAASGPASWGRPSAMPSNRTAFVVGPGSRGGADVAAAAAAGLAAAASALRGTDAGIATDALRHAQQLYALAALLPANETVCAMVTCARGLPGKGGYAWHAYVSTSVYDDMALAAAWLYANTGAHGYAADAAYLYAQHLATEAPRGGGAAAAPAASAAASVRTLPGAHEAGLAMAPAPDPTYYAPNYDNSAWAAALLMAHLGIGGAAPSAVLSSFFRAWLTGSAGPGQPVLLSTPRGLAHLSGHPAAGDEPLPNAAAAAALALAHAKTVPQRTALALRCFALRQVSYMLGGGGTAGGRSFVVGLGPAPPAQARHAQASCAGPPGAPCNAAAALSTPEPNPHAAAGALVAGPAADDSYTDDRRTPGARVGMQYNVQLMAALAGLLQAALSPQECLQGRGLFQATFYSDLV